LLASSGILHLKVWGPFWTGVCVCSNSANDFVEVILDGFYTLGAGKIYLTYIWAIRVKGTVFWGNL